MHEKIEHKTEMVIICLCYNNYQGLQEFIQKKNYISFFKYNFSLSDSLFFMNQSNTVY